MDSIERDLAYLQAGIPEIKEYLLSKEIYWPLTARGFQLPRLTIGGLLLAQTRLMGINRHLEQFNLQLESVRTAWQVAWGKKAGQEFKARIGLWKAYLMDYQYAPEQHADAYPYEVRLRVMLHLLGEELSDQPDEQQVLPQLDKILHRSLVQSMFIWAEYLQKAFPAEVYWYLYGNLKH
jgi:hypothetical protein